MDSLVKMEQPLAGNELLSEMKAQSLDALVEFYKNKLLQHPLAKLARENAIPKEVLIEFAKIQYVDSTLWIPMLSIIKGRIQEPRLLKAVTDNILCESGYAGMPHTTMCANFVKSVGAPLFFGDFHTYAPLASHPVEIMNAIHGMSESELCGWLLVAETLVPTLFQIMRPAFAKLPNVDMQYLDEHIEVDCVDHAIWMRESAVNLLAKSDCSDLITTGIDLGGRVTLSIPDALYSRILQMRA